MLFAADHRKKSTGAGRRFPVNLAVMRSRFYFLGDYRGNSNQVFCVRKIPAAWAEKSCYVSNLCYNIHNSFPIIGAAPGCKQRWQSILQEAAMITVAIVEDNKAYSNLLNEYLKRFEKEENVSFQVDRFFDGREFLSSKTAVDIVLMDIEMPKLNGMDAARQLRQTDSNAIIIFVTNMIQYAINGYEVDAVGFMVKPVQYYPFYLQLKKAVRRYNLTKSEEITIEDKGNIYRIRLKDIIYIEVMGRLVTFHTVTGDTTVDCRLHTIYSELKGKGFELCNNCYLVNMSHVSSVRGDSVFLRDIELKMSRRRKKEFKEAFAQYIGGGVI